MFPWGRSDKQPDSDSIPKPIDSKSTESWDEENPFIAFRKFADEQVSTLLSGLNALPDMLSEVRSKAEEHRQQWQHAHPHDQWQAHQSQHSHTALLPPFPFPVAPNEESREAARALLLQARNANTGVNPRAVLALYKDTPHAFLDSPFDPAWLSIDWFKTSPYSPIHLETHSHLHADGSKWRAAFEDLMCASLGKEQEAHPAWTNQTNNQSLYASWAQAPVDWMLGLQCRGILPPQLPSLYQMRKIKAMDRVFADIVGDKVRQRVWNSAPGDLNVLSDFEQLAVEIGAFDEDERAEQAREQTRSQAPAQSTEMDMYEQFLKKAESGNKSGRDHESLSNKEEQSKKVVANDATSITASKILSTLSTTETTTLPDGTITTRVVMKKRFTDGREESTETVSTTHSLGESISGSTASSTTSPKLDNAVADTQAKQNEKKGWFWS